MKKKHKKGEMKGVAKTLKSKEVFVTQSMLYEVRDELKSDIASLSLRMESRFKRVDARFSEIEARVDEVLSEVKSQNAKFHRMLTLYEEQESRNRYVLDGYTSLNDRLEILESKADR